MLRAAPSESNGGESNENFERINPFWLEQLLLKLKSALIPCQID
jgi:hypothetical protein